MAESKSYRVFLSYSHLDEKLVTAIEDCLRENGLTPMRDTNFAYGVGFHDQIRRFIEYSHVFMPIITKQSSERGWVHQEIGYAMAQNVPVLPVAIDGAPGEWLQLLHSVILTKEQVKKHPKMLRRIFSHALFEQLVNRFRDDSFAVYSCGNLQEDRTKMIAAYASEVSQIQTLLSSSVHHDRAVSGFVRQKGALSSFHIPDDPIEAEVWMSRYGKKNRRSAHHCRLQREERLALTEHAREYGSRLIVDPNTEFSHLKKKAIRVRLNCLLKFLNSEDAQLTEIAITDLRRAESVTIVGDWFMALASAFETGGGYYQTIFTRHAPSMELRIAGFDEEFHRILDDNKTTPAKSRENAIDKIQKIANNL